MSNIIFVFGPSCGGKSTLGKALQKNLGDGWTYIDRDDLVEQGISTDATADQTLDQRIRSIKDKIIIDAQIPWREKKKGEFYFMVLPPLGVLLERDAKRTIKLQRPEKRAYYAREYVVKTYNTLSKMEKKNFDHCFDSSRESVADEIKTVKTVLDATHMLEQLQARVQGDPSVQIVRLRNATITSAMAKALVPLTALKTLQLHRSSVSVPVLSEIAALFPHLGGLSVNTDVLKAAIKVEEIGLKRRVDATCFDALFGAFKQLDNFAVDGKQHDLIAFETAAACARNMPHLKTLQLAHSRLPALSIAALQFKELRTLDLQGSLITDLTLQRLSDLYDQGFLRKLTTLSLANCKIVSSCEDLSAEHILEAADPVGENPPYTNHGRAFHLLKSKLPKLKILFSNEEPSSS